MGSSNSGTVGMFSTVRKSGLADNVPTTPFRLGFDDIVVSSTLDSPTCTPGGCGLVLRPSPVTSKTQRESLEAVIFDPFSPATRRMSQGRGIAAAAMSSAGSSHYGISHAATATTPAMTPRRDLNASPGSAFSSFSPFISPSCMESVMKKHVDGMTMTPAIVGSATHSLVAPSSWEPVDSTILAQTFSFGETPSRKLDVDDFLVGTSSGGSVGPKLPGKGDLSHHSSRIKLEEEDDGNYSGGEEDDEVPIIQSSFSFSDVLSPDEKSNHSTAAVTDSGPLRMRSTSTTKDVDLSTHHFDAWQSPAGNNLTSSMAEEYSMSLKREQD
jgi:hypothetical protein